MFDLDELLVLLDHLGAEDIVSFPVPVEAKFCDHMVVVSAKSRRHLQAINEEMLYIVSGLIDILRLDIVHNDIFHYCFQSF